MSQTTPPRSPDTGDLYRCEKCDFELQVTQGCECEPGCVSLKCCGEELKLVTEPEVANP